MTTTEQDRIQAEIDAMRAEARAKAREFDAKYVTHRRAMGRAVIASGGKITSPGSETDSRRAHNAEISGATPEPAI